VSSPPEHSASSIDKVGPIGAAHRPPSGVISVRAVHQPEDSQLIVELNRLLAALSNSVERGLHAVGVVGGVG
jgi:hypothetical protein